MTILEFLYNTVPGRFLLKPLTGHGFLVSVGIF